MSVEASQIQEKSEEVVVEDKLIKRLLHACIREQLLPYTLTDNVLSVTLQQSKKKLLATHVQRFNLGKLKIDGDVIICTNENYHPITKAEYLLNLIYDELKNSIDGSQWEKFVDEINNCGTNALLVSKFLHQFNNKLISDISHTKHTHFIDYIKSRYTLAESAMFFEAWAAKGHPYHPCHKTKLGFSSAAYLKYSPEFNQEIHLPIAAIEKSCVQVSAEENNFDYNHWFATTYPAVWQAWSSSLTNKGLPIANFSPIFIHPWQLENVVNKLFNNLLESGQLIPFHDVTISTKATLSFRTLMVNDEAKRPHIKLPVAVHSTSALRTITPASVHNGTELGKILRQILAKEETLQQCLKFAYETCGLYVQHSNPEIAKHLGVIYRENPEQYVTAQQIPIVVAALFEASPVSKLPLFIELLHAANGYTLEAAIDYFDHYCRIVLMAYFDLFLIYGIALEGHQQNTISVFENNKLAFIIARDLGGLRVHLPTVLSHKLDLVPYPQSATITNDSLDATDKFLHTVIQYHLGEIILLLSQYYQKPETIFWNIVKDNLEKRFQELKSRVDSARWEAEYKTIMLDDWQIKGLMSMRLKNMHSKYVHINCKNPLRDY